MKYSYLGLILIFGSVFSLGGDSTSTPKPTPEVKDAAVHLSVASENKILKAEHQYDLVINQEKDLGGQFDELKEKIRNIQDQYKQLQTKETPAAKAVADAIEDAWKDSGLDKLSYDFDPANFTFTLKKEAKAEKK